MILKLIGMLVLGLVSAALSYYDKNFYVRVFNDILGREEEEDVTAKVGRGFFYGFFFPIYFVLLLSGLMALISFLIVAGIIAAIVFVIVWVTEKILPNQWIGKLCLDLFSKIGLSGPTPKPSASVEQAIQPPASPADTKGESPVSQCAESSSPSTPSSPEKV
jgi:hypothetical protein